LYLPPQQEITGNSIRATYETIRLRMVAVGAARKDGGASGMELINGVHVLEPAVGTMASEDLLRTGTHVSGSEPKRAGGSSMSMNLGRDHSLSSFRPLLRGRANRPSF